MGAVNHDQNASVARVLDTARRRRNGGRGIPGLNFIGNTMQPVADALDCFRFGGQVPASRRGGFERLGTDAAEMAVTTGTVVEHFDVVEHIGSGEVAGFVDPFADAFLFQAAEE